MEGRLAQVAAFERGVLRAVHHGNSGPSTQGPGAAQPPAPARLPTRRVFPPVGGGVVSDVRFVSDDMMVAAYYGGVVLLSTQPGRQGLALDHGVRRARRGGSLGCLPMMQRGGPAQLAPWAAASRAG